MEWEECEETEPQENMEISVENMENLREAFFLLKASLRNIEQFNIETKHSYPKINSNSSSKSKFKHGVEMNSLENLDLSRLPLTIIIENESKNLPNTIIR